MKPIYELKNLYTNYSHKPVLDISALSILEGEILGLVGANGSGKSTLLRHLAFLEKAQRGDLLYKGYNAQTIPLAIKREIAILLPEPYLLKRSVKENLLFGLKAHGEMAEAKKRVDEALDLVGLLPKKFKHREWHELSSGETQRVALASRLVLHPKTLLLDEPTNSLDYSGIPQFSDAILHANKEWGTTIVVASHDLLWLSEISTRKIGLHFGRLMDFSTTNLIVGKWREEGENQIFDFSQTQRIVLSKKMRIGEKRGIIINPREITVMSSPQKPLFQSNHIFLEGIVRDISHLANSNEISLKINVGCHTLESIQSFEAYERNHFFPSQQIYLCFEENAIQVP